MRINTLIVDSEPVARRRLRRVLLDDSQLEIIGEARTSTEALAAMEAHQIDLVFLEVEMPGGDGFDCLRRAPRPLPVVVFVTAFEQHAVRAFEAHALDYLLKPFSDERLRDAVMRAKEQIRHRQSRAMNQRVEQMPRAMPDAEHAAENGSGVNDRYPTRLVARRRQGTLFVAVRNIDWIEAVGYRVRLHTTAGTSYLRAPIRRLERWLDPACFVRVHRSVIVRIDQIREIRPYHRAASVVVLRDGTQVPLSRRRRAVVDKALHHGAPPSEPPA